jgi:type IV secretory pathway component VirB8
MSSRQSSIESPLQEKTPFTAAIDWESSRIHAIEKSERRAWTVAIVATILCVVAIVAVALLTPLKESVPYVIRVDSATGVPDLITTIKDKEVTGDDVMNKYWLAQYIRARETYDWYTIQTDYNMVGLLSSANVGAGYSQQFEGPNAIDKKFGKSVRATVEIVSVVPNGPNSGTVRFIKTTKRVDQEGGSTTSEKWVATVAFEYRSTARIKESDRLLNPFGFQVLSYRVDPEMAGGAQ